MPELPEVETISQDLKKELKGKKITAVLIEKSYVTHPAKEQFVKALLNSNIKDIRRIAKVIALELSNGNFLTFHLAMTGRLLLKSAGDAKEAHTKVILEFEDGKQLRFSDVRMFGYVRLLNQDEFEALKNKYGPSPFHKSLTTEKLVEILGKKKTQIKRALLEQDLISGLGNIYANDSLWIAMIHPQTDTKKIDLNKAEKLLLAMQEILTEAVAHRGSTLEDLMYVDIYGKSGSHQNHFRVYGRAGKPCIRCETPIESIIIGGRSTYFCPTCQKL